MATTEFFRRLGRAWLLAGIAVAAPALAGDDIAGDWSRLLADGEPDAVYGTYALIGKVHGADGLVDADLCREQADAIAAALKVNPVGLGLWQMAQDCARAAGDEALAQQRLTRFEALLRHTFAGYRLGEDRPMRVLSEHDVDAVIAASGQTVLYQFYEPYDGGRELSYTVGLWDEKTQRENVLSFDFLDAAVALRHRLPEAEFPSFRSRLVEALVAESVESSPDSALAQVVILKTGNGPELIAELERQARAGNFMAAVIQAMACAEYKALDCNDAAVDALLPFAEKRYSLAMVALAFVYARNSDKSADLKAARALIEQADARLGDAQGSIAFAGLCLVLGKRADVAGLVEKNLEKATGAGNVMAGLSLSVMQTVSKRALPMDRYLGYVQAAADADIPAAQYWLGLIRLVEGRPEQAQVLMRKAAAGGNAQSQLWLGKAQYFGQHGVERDEAKGLEWLRQAAHGGQGDAGALVGSYYLERSDEVANLQRAHEWLRGAVLAGSEYGALQLARLYARNVDGVGTTEQAVEMYQAVIDDHDNPTARRELARLLTSGNGVEKDEKRAEALLRVHADKGIADTQFALSRLLLSQDGAERKAEGVAWLRKAADQGHTGSRSVLAAVLWYGNGAAVDRDAARQLWLQLIAAGDSPQSSNDYAWALCTPRDAALLDARTGLAAITPLTGSADAPFGFVDTLAACQAAAGDFTAAVATQERALALIEKRADVPSATLDGARARLALYRKGERAVADR